MSAATADREATPSTATSRRNLVAIARPYFGMIVVTSLLLCAWGAVSMLRMPSGSIRKFLFRRL